MMSSTDRIEKKILVRAPRARLWQALTDTELLGKWLSSRIERVTVAPGAILRGPVIVPGFEHEKMDAIVEKVEPERYLSWRWHPGSTVPIDTSGEPRTLVEFHLEDAEGGTLLTVVESGFDALAARRDEARRGNDAGWTEVTRSIARDVGAA
jgi:uncharacterized protein YndB with AHSA1/START domain